MAKKRKEIPGFIMCMSKQLMRIQDIINYDWLEYDKEILGEAIKFFK